jgi:hypothetical protein
VYWLEAGGDAMENADKRGDGKRGTARDAAVLRTFPVLGLEGNEGRTVLKVNGNAVYAIDVTRATATLTTAADGPARSGASFDSQKSLDEIIAGRLHPIIAGLQRRCTLDEGDRRFGLSVLLALRASAPPFADRRA